MRCRSHGTVAALQRLCNDRRRGANLGPDRDKQLALLGASGRRLDGIVPPEMNAPLAESFPQMTLWVVASGHSTDRTRAFLISRADALPDTAREEHDGGGRGGRPEVHIEAPERVPEIVIWAERSDLEAIAIASSASMTAHVKGVRRSR